MFYKSNSNVLINLPVIKFLFGFLVSVRTGRVKRRRTWAAGVHEVKPFRKHIKRLNLTFSRERGA